MSKMPELEDKLKNGLLDDFLRERGRRHKYYRTYNKIPRLFMNYYVDKKLYLSDGFNWNDVIDADYFYNASDKIKYYGLCFSYSINESVAMWMLYGGLYDEGAMLNLTNKYVNSICEYCNTIKIGNFTENGFDTVDELHKENGDFVIYLKDVLYHKKNKNNTSLVMHNNISKNGIDNSIIAEANPVLKDNSWSYENEVRLIIEIRKTELTQNCHYAQVDLSEFEKEYKKANNRAISKANNAMTCSPKLVFDESTELYIKKGKYRKKVRKSKLSGLINWSLTEEPNKNPSISKELKDKTVIISIE